MYELIVLYVSFKGFPYPSKTSPEKLFGLDDFGNVVVFN